MEDAPMLEERKKLLEQYKGLRVTDVNDAMDIVGHMNLGMMDHDIRPFSGRGEYHPLLRRLCPYRSLCAD